MSDKPTTLRDDIRAILRASWDGRSCGSIAAELGRETEQVRYSLRALKDRKEAVKDESGLWYLRQDGIVPEHVGIIRRLDPDVAEVEERVLQAQEDEPEVVTRPMDEPRAIVELAEHLDEQEALQRISMIPTDKLVDAASELKAFRERMDKAPPVPPVEHMVVLKLKVPASVARRILELVP